MADHDVRRVRSDAWAAMLVRLRAEHLDEYRGLLKARSGKKNATILTRTELRQRHPVRAKQLYQEELLARGLPAPAPQPGRWPDGAR